MVVGSGRFDGLVGRLGRSTRLDPADRDAIAAWPSADRAVRAEDLMIDEGATPEACLLLLSGIAARIKLTRDGRRQILSFHFPGDLIDLQGLFLARADHGVQAITQARVAEIPTHSVLRAVRERPAIAQALWRDTLADASMLRERVLNLGRRDARARIAHLLCEVETRIAGAAAADPAGFDFPVTQEDIADATGLTPVHVNRTLRSLREEGVLDYRGGRVTMKDRARIAAIGQFDPAYLHLGGGTPRA